ncbi:MAG TPA: energy transducer TonB [Edaphobacter sp.]|uniref:energy transducer TonB n=1 Tax=Edaphobacter sp. TaxID=1934404 RepID=UPI002B865292|nr:energy transducer TonB [Edaphobacter sp.]HUZ94767.1 energy transducer TonB [Edaphobacter sp.]
MFEDSLVVSQVRHTSSPERWTALASMGFQFALAALIIAIPLLHPERLTFVAETPRILLPLPPRTPITIQHAQAASYSSNVMTPATTHPMPMLPRFIPLPGDDAPLITAISSGSGMTDGSPINVALGDSIHEPRVVVIPARVAKGPVRISSGVSTGMLIAPIRPIYPEIARAARVEGKVVVEATISRTGAIESLHVVSGPAMLQRAALDAIRAARYQPYQLNGSPTEVQTTISVNFRLGS